MKKAVYIVGGGPSLRQFDFNLLVDKDTIAVNASLEDVPSPNYFITCCSGFCRKVVANSFYGVETYKVMVISKQHSRYEKIKRFLPAFDEVINPATGDGELGFTYDTFAVGGNSGFCALQYAVLLGYTTIYLLGIDVQIRNGLHYHDRSGLVKKEVGWWKECFERGLSIIKEQSDIKVFSCSPISDLNAMIPFIDFKDIKNELD